MINEANNLDQVANVDCRGPNPGLFHDAYRAFAVRARPDREHGTRANQVIWEGPTVIYGDTACELNSFLTMDGWLSAVEKDRGGSLPAKIIRDKPNGLSDECWDGSGQKVSDTLCPAGVVNVEGTPRTVAGDAITTDANKCQLKPLSPAEYSGLGFTGDEWAQLRGAFPGVNGGRPLGKPPASTEVRVPEVSRRR